MEILNTTVKDLNPTYKMGVGLLILVIWPLAIAFVFLNNKNFFNNTDIVKLTILCASFAMPVILVNSMLLYFILMPFNMELRRRRPVNKPTASAFLISIVLAAFILIIANLFAFFVTPAYTMPIAIGMEILLVLKLTYTIWQEKTDSLFESPDGE